MTSPIIKRDNVQVSATTSSTQRASTRVLGPGSSSPCTGEKGVRLMNEGGDVRAIEFTCACGDVTVVELQYTNGSTSSPS